MKSKILFTALVTMVFLSGCASLPEPGPKHQTIFVIPVTAHNSTDSEYYVKYSMKIASLVHTIQNRGHLLIIRDLPPGVYTGIEIWNDYLHDKKPRYYTKSFNNVIKLESGKITVLASKLDINLFSPGARKYRQSIELVPLNEHEKILVYEQLKNYKNVDLWSFQEP